MKVMTKQEIEVATHVWPANVKAPIDRDTQIHMIKTAEWRHKQLQNKYKELFEKKGKGYDPLG